MTSFIRQALPDLTACGRRSARRSTRASGGVLISNLEGVKEYKQRAAQHHYDAHCDVYDRARPKTWLGRWIGRICCHFVSSTLNPFKLYNCPTPLQCRQVSKVSPIHSTNRHSFLELSPLSAVRKNGSSNNCRVTGQKNLDCAVNAIRQLGDALCHVFILLVVANHVCTSSLPTSSLHVLCLPRELSAYHRRDMPQYAREASGSRTGPARPGSHTRGAHSGAQAVGSRDSVRDKAAPFVGFPRCFNVLGRFL